MQESCNLAYVRVYTQLDFIKYKGLPLIALNTYC